jgi:hypothetical protein
MCNVRMTQFASWLNVEVLGLDLNIRCSSVCLRGVASSVSLRSSVSACETCKQPNNIASPSDRTL